MTRRLREFAGATSDVDRLRIILNTKLTDDQIVGGVDLSQSGMQKVAARLGVAASDVPTLMKSLRSKISRELRDDETKALSEDERFSMEPDILGNVTVRDGVSGRSVVLRGDEAAKARMAYKRGGAAALRDFLPISETVLAEFQAENGDFSFDEEIASTSRGGTFNFPWRAAGRHGFGTARFDRTGTVTRVLHVSDANGEPIQPDTSLLEQIKRVAQDFVGQE